MSKCQRADGQNKQDAARSTGKRVKGNAAEMNENGKGFHRGRGRGGERRYIICVGPLFRLPPHSLSVLISQMNKITFRFKILNRFLFNRECRLFLN